jgi:hypothetical protein
VEDDEPLSLVIEHLVDNQHVGEDQLLGTDQ